MARSYRHIQQYEKEILEMREKGFTLREIGERLGFSYKQMRNFITRYNANQRKIASGIVINPKGRPRKDGIELPPSVQKLSIVTQLKYELAQKERENKRLKMENELMRDFLSLTGRK
jgi:lambda repressor-like predicted transcriptional regulator